MRAAKIVTAGTLAAAFVAASASSADAYWHGHRGYYGGGYYDHRGPGPVLGLVGGVVVGAATIATLPFAIVGAALGARPAPPPPAYGPGPDYYGPPPPPPRGYYGPPRRYYGESPRAYYGY